MITEVDVINEDLKTSIGRSRRSDPNHPIQLFNHDVSIKTPTKTTSTIDWKRNKENSQIMDKIFRVFFIGMFPLQAGTEIGKHRNANVISTIFGDHEVDELVRKIGDFRFSVGTRRFYRRIGTCL